MTRLRYTRVSTSDQDTELQIRELQGVNGYTTTTASAEAKQATPNWTRCWNASAKAMKSSSGNWTDWAAPPATFSNYSMASRQAASNSTPSMTTSSPTPTANWVAMAQAMATLISAFAQLERNQISEPTKTGMTIAASHGRKAGRREVTDEALW